MKKSFILLAIACVFMVASEAKAQGSVKNTSAGGVGKFTPKGTVTPNPGVTVTGASYTTVDPNGNLGPAGQITVPANGGPFTAGAITTSIRGTWSITITVSFSNGGAIPKVADVLVQQICSHANPPPCGAGSVFTVPSATKNSFP